MAIPTDLWANSSPRFVKLASFATYLCSSCLAVQEHLVEVHHEIDCTRIAMNPKFKGLEVQFRIPTGSGRNGKCFSWKNPWCQVWSIFTARKPWWNIKQRFAWNLRITFQLSIQLQIDKLLLSSPLSPWPGKPGCCVLQLPSCRICWRLFRRSSLGELAPWYLTAGSFMGFLFRSHPAGPLIFFNKRSCFIVDIAKKKRLGGPVDLGDHGAKNDLSGEFDAAVFPRTAVLHEGWRLGEGAVGGFTWVAGGFTVSLEGSGYWDDRRLTGGGNSSTF